MNDITVIIDKDEWGLVELAASINRNIHDAESRAQSATMLALEAGMQLNRAKELVPHGAWNDWLTTNVDVAPRTAQAYMRLAKRLPTLPSEKARRVADLPLRDAVKAIATPPTSPESDLRRRHYVRLEERDRIRKGFATCASALRELGKQVDSGIPVEAKKIANARKALERTVGLLAELEQFDNGVTS